MGNQLFSLIINQSISLSFVQQLHGFSHLFLKDSIVHQISFDVFNGQINQHPSYLRSIIFSCDDLNILVDSFSNLRLVVRVLRCCQVVDTLSLLLILNVNRCILSNHGRLLLLLHHGRWHLRHPRKLLLPRVHAHLRSSRNSWDVLHHSSLRVSLSGSIVSTSLLLLLRSPPILHSLLVIHWSHIILYRSEQCHQVLTLWDVSKSHATRSLSTPNIVLEISLVPIPLNLLHSMLFDLIVIHIELLSINGFPVQLLLGTKSHVGGLIANEGVECLTLLR